MIKGFEVGKKYRFISYAEERKDLPIFQGEICTCTKVALGNTSVASFDCDECTELMEDYSMYMQNFELIEDPIFSIIVPSFQVSCSKNPNKEFFGTDPETLATVLTKIILFIEEKNIKNKEDFEQLFLTMLAEHSIPESCLIPMAGSFIITAALGLTQS